MTKQTMSEEVVSPTIQPSELVSENSEIDTIEMLYIESPSISLSEFRDRIKQYALSKQIEARIDEIKHATVARVANGRNKKSSTFMSGFRFAANNLQDFKSKRLSQLRQQQERI